MKTKLVSISLVTMFFSCQKCQECTITTVQNVSGINQTTNTSQEYCGDEYNNAPEEGTVSQNLMGINQTVTVDCVDQ